MADEQYESLKQRWLDQPRQLAMGAGWMESSFILTGGVPEVVAKHVLTKCFNIKDLDATTALPFIEQN